MEILCVSLHAEIKLIADQSMIRKTGHILSRFAACLIVFEQEVDIQSAPRYPLFLINARKLNHHIFC
jgi:hypothetical protein